MEPGDVGLHLGLAPHHLGDSKVKLANPKSLSPLLCKTELLWALPASGVQTGRRRGRLSDNQGPRTQGALNLRSELRTAQLS